MNDKNHSSNSDRSVLKSVVKLHLKRFCDVRISENTSKNENKR